MTVTPRQQAKPVHPSGLVHGDASCVVAGSVSHEARPARSCCAPYRKTRARAASTLHTRQASFGAPRHVRGRGANILAHTKTMRPRRGPITVSFSATAPVQASGAGPPSRVRVLPACSRGCGERSPTALKCSWQCPGGTRSAGGEPNAPGAALAWPGPIAADPRCGRERVPQQAAWPIAARTPLLPRHCHCRGRHRPFAHLLASSRPKWRQPGLARVACRRRPWQLDQPAIRQRLPRARPGSWPEHGERGQRGRHGRLLALRLAATSGHRRRQRPTPQAQWRRRAAPRRSPRRRPEASRRGSRLCRACRFPGPARRLLLRLRPPRRSAAASPWTTWCGAPSPALHERTAAALAPPAGAAPARSPSRSPGAEQRTAPRAAVAGWPATALPHAAAGQPAPLTGA